MVFQHLGREMELLVFGMPACLCCLSHIGGRFYELKTGRMIAALSGKIDAGNCRLLRGLVDMESWYNRRRRRLAHRPHVQYETTDQRGGAAGSPQEP